MRIDENKGMSDRRRTTMAILRQTRRAQVNHLDPHLVTAVALHLYGQNLLQAGAERELFVTLDQLGPGELLQLEHRYADGKEVKLATVRATVGAEGAESVAQRWHVRLPADQVPADLMVSHWVRLHVDRNNRQRLHPVGFRRVLNHLTNEELESVRQLFMEDLQNEALVKGSFRGKYGLDILRQATAEIDAGRLTAGTRLFIDRLAGDNVLCKLLHQRIRIGRLGIQQMVRLDGALIPAAVARHTTTELLAAGNNEAILVVGADGSLSPGQYRTDPAPLPAPRRQARKHHYEAAEIPAGLRDKLRKAVSTPPVGPNGLRSSVRLGSVHIRWHYYEATGYLNGRVIWRLVIINDQLMTYEQMAREKTEEQTRLEAEVEHLNADMALRQGELDAVVAELEQTQTSIDDLSNQKAESEQTAAQARAEQAEADAEAADLGAQYAEAAEELSEAQDEQALDQQDLADEHEQAAEVQEDLNETRVQEEYVRDHEESLASDLAEQEESLAESESEAADAAAAASEAADALAAAEAELAELEGRYRPTVVDRATWGARAPNKDAGWDEYPAGTPLADLLDTIVVHHTADAQSMSVQELQNWEMDDNGYADVPYHFVITEDGTIYEGRQIDAVGAHAGTSTDPDNQDITLDPDYGAIGIVLMGDFEQRLVNPFPDTPTAGQLSSLKSLAGHLCRTYSVDPDDILKHSEVARGGTPTVCPGGKMAPEVERIRAELASELPGYDATVQAQRDLVAALTADRDARQAASDAAADRAAQMQEQVRQAQANLDAVRSDLDAIRNELDGLQSDLDAHQAEAEEISERMAERENTMQSLQEALNDLGNQILAAESRSADAQQTAEEHEQRADELQREINEAQQHKAELEQSREGLEQEIADLQREAETKQGRIDELDAEIGTPHEIGDEDGLDEEAIEFEADYEDPWTLLQENTELGEWEIGILRATPNVECAVCALHANEEYFYGEPETPYHPNCDCPCQEVVQQIHAR